jgi:hypothetical protein
MMHEAYADQGEEARPLLTPTTPDMLERILARWLEIDRENAKYRREMLRMPYIEEYARNAEELRAEMVAEAKPYMARFLEDNSTLSAEELEEIAEKLSPGGAHTGGLLVRLVRANLWDADPLLVAATIWSNWHGGKVGFQFLPDPAETDPDVYRDEVDELIELRLRSVATA